MALAWEQAVVSLQTMLNLPVSVSGRMALGRVEMAARELEC
jgi:hypothetical protein